MMAVRVERDLVFAAPDGSELTLDIYRAPQDDAPVTVYVHGGGWRGGDKADDAARRLTPLSACGVTVASVNYRLVPARHSPATCTTSGRRCAGCAGTGRRAPFLIAHGDRDHIVASSEGRALHSALVRAGADSRFELLGGAGHEGAEFDHPASLALTAAWLRVMLQNPVA